MAPCSHRPSAPLLLLLLLCCLRMAVATASSSYYSFPAFDGKSTADGVVVTTDSAMLAPATFLFDAKLFPRFNRSRGFVLLSRPVALWRLASSNGTRDNAEGEGEAENTMEEASFSTSFTVDVGGGSSSVSFVVLLDSFPPLKGNRHGPRASTYVESVDVSAAPNATNGLAAVELGTVRSYGPRSPAVGLNVTITPNRSSAVAGANELAVRIEYDAAMHRLSVYVDEAAASKSGSLRNTSALLEAPFDLADRLPTQAALLGFFSSTVRDVVAGVRGWELTVDTLPDEENDEQRRAGHDDDDDRASSPSTLAILVAVFGSVAAVGVVVVSVKLYVAVSRRRAQDKELQQCYSAYFARTRL